MDFILASWNLDLTYHYEDLNKSIYLFMHIKVHNIWLPWSNECDVNSSCYHSKKLKFVQFLICKRPLLQKLHLCSESGYNSQSIAIYYIFLQHNFLMHQCIKKICKQNTEPYKNVWKNYFLAEVVVLHVLQMAFKIFWIKNDLDNCYVCKII